MSTKFPLIFTEPAKLKGSAAPFAAPKAPIKVTIDKPDGSPMVDQYVGSAAAEQIVELLNPLLKGEQHRVIKKLRRDLREGDKEIDWNGLEKKIFDGKIDHDKFAVMLLRWVREPLVLQKPSGCSLHRLQDAFVSDRVLSPFVRKTIGEILIPKNFVPFVVEHDWAAAFANAQGFADGEVNAPYPSTCYEFLISGHRVCALFGDGAKGSYRFCPFVECGEHWVIPQYAYYKDPSGGWMPSQRGASIEDDHFRPLTDLILRQVRAICVALDAEVAEADVVRAPHRLNLKRERNGHLPLSDYHIVRLTNRRRYAPLHESSESIRRRMHFVRGHWRHYEGHKTWIKWHLRGDPDLGFIDKHYRL
ncbi:MAG TPA: hypothetical protein VNT29_09175 [Candidatus Limnocylindrales bacterium]|nr:hypothetical protein [Candidatus Limnocylindrales bacterium]